jgi:serine/threonine protein kinase
LNETICAQILWKLLRGINFCHELNICHRDIKLENILVDLSQEPVDVKIIDFGFSIEVKEPKERLKFLCGTTTYMSPELCRQELHEGPPTDMWAIGIVFYSILFGK